MTTITSIPTTTYSSLNTHDNRNLYIGCGPKDVAGLALNNKVHGQKYTSVTTLALDPPPGLFENFQPWKGKPLSLQKALERIVLVVEDASPDSVFGLLVVLARVHGVAMDEIPRAWVLAVQQWEATGNCGAPETSWCALVSALVHSRFPRGQHIDDATYGAVWREALRFLVTCLRLQLDPEAIPPLPTVAEWGGASAALNGDRLTYLDWLDHAHILQLSLPRTHGKDRRSVIDGLLFVEDEAAGAARIFYRNDKANSPLKEGFAFAAHYRPGARPGETITITVDPRTGTHLRELWEELERLETAAWAASKTRRPATAPRRLHAAPENLFNDPWYLNDDATLIAAPASGSAKQDTSSKLSWNEVCDAIWRVYSPLRNVMIQPTDGGPVCPIQKLGEFALQVGSKRLLTARWPRNAGASEVAARGLSSAPSVFRSLAALIGHNGTGTQTLSELPVSTNWTVVPLNGGLSVISSEGMFVLDDWREQPLNVDAVRQAFESAALLDQALSKLSEHRLKPLMENVSEFLKTRQDRKRTPERSHDRKSLEMVLREIGRVKLELAGLRGKHAAPPEDADARTIRSALDTQWGLEQRFAAADTLADDLTGSLQSLNAMRTSRISRWIGLYGFPIFVASGLGPQVAKLIMQFRQSDPAKAAAIDAPAWLNLTAILAIAAALIVIVKIMVQIENPLRRK